MRFTYLGTSRLGISVSECERDGGVDAPSATPQIAADRAAILNLVLEARAYQVEFLASALRRWGWLR
jgi:hypothetical protein